jgi:hypothetical protein
LLRGHGASDADQILDANRQQDGILDFEPSDTIGLLKGKIYDQTTVALEKLYFVYERHNLASPPVVIEF